jgi:hypothetical protein
VFCFRSTMQKRFAGRAIVRFPLGMLARVKAVLKPGECRATFILAATAAALRKVEQKRAAPWLGSGRSFWVTNHRIAPPPQEGVAVQLMSAAVV